MSSGEAVLHEDASAPWYAGLTPRHWRILWGSYLGWIFDGYEAVAAELDDQQWEILVAETRPRTASNHDGESATVHDTVLRALRRS